MNIDQDDEDHGGNGHDHGYAPALDPFTAALVLIDLALNPKATKAALKKLAQVDKSIGAAEQKLVAVTAQVEQTNNALAERESAIAAREKALDEREAGFADALKDAHATLRQYYDSIAAEDTRVRYRIMAHANLLHGFNERLQILPSWQQLRQMVPDLPADLPALKQTDVMRIDALSDTSDDPNADRHGNVFLGTLSRDVSHKDAA